MNAATSYKTKAVIKDVNNNEISSSPSAKYLGVTIDANCSMASHVENVKKKIRSRSWALNLLRRNGFKEEELVKVYCTHIRPLTEYASEAWGPMITQEQGATIERQQN